MADKKNGKRKEKIKHFIKEKLKHKKVVGDPKITGVTRPKKKKPHTGDEGRDSKKDKDRPILVGPRGGKYKQGPAGKKQYSKKSMPEAVKEVIDDILEKGKVTDFIETFKKGGNSGRKDV